MSTATPEFGGSERVIEVDSDLWLATVVSPGRTSAYLSPRVHRPIVEFRCRSGRAPRRYAPLPAEAATLQDVTDEALGALWARARVH